MPRCTGVGSLIVTLSFCGAALCPAQQADEQRTTEIRVWVIRATTKNKDISPELKELANKLKREFKFTGFKLEKRAGGSTGLGKTFATALIGGYHAEVTPKENDGKKVQLQLRILQEKGKEKTPKASTTFTVHVREFQLFGGWELDEGDALIVAVSAQ